LVIGDSDADERTLEVEIARGDPAAVTSTSQLDEGPVAIEGTPVPLGALAYGRSGDKGNLANIGLIARRPEFADALREQVTAARVAEHFAHLRPAAVRRWAVPGLDAINIVLDEVLGGTGGTSTLRYDPQGKSYAAMLLTMQVRVPPEWLSTGVLTGGAA
jgi:hypothetical protein